MTTLSYKVTVKLSFLNLVIFCIIFYDQCHIFGISMRFIYFYVTEPKKFYSFLKRDLKENKALSYPQKSFIYHYDI